MPRRVRNPSDQGRFMKTSPRGTSDSARKPQRSQKPSLGAAADRAFPPEDLTFRPSAGTSLGVELELQILDRETGDLAPGAVRLLQACREEAIEGVTAELLQSMVEIKTGVCRDVNEVRDTL